MTLTNVKHLNNEKLCKNLMNIALNNVGEAVIITDERNRIIYINKQFEKITGYTLNEVEGKTPKYFQSGIQEDNFYREMKSAVNDTGHWQGELWNRKKNGELYLQSMSIVASKNKNGKIENFVGVISNLFQNKVVMLENAYKESYYDDLTKLPKRSLFEKKMFAAQKQAEQDKSKLAVILFRIHNLTAINKKYGFLYGDIILKRISARMQSQIDNNYMITRWSGTTFATVVENIKSKGDIVSFMKELSDLLSQPMIIGGDEIQIHCNFGMTMYEGGTKSFADLLSEANNALQIARENNELYLFFDEKQDKVDEFYILEYELEKALEQDELDLYYQPLIDVGSREIQGFEALVRWHHPTKGLIPPMKFIPLAEQTDLIKDIGYIVLRKACEQQVLWEEKGLKRLPIYVNLSVKQFQDEKLVDKIMQTLEETKVEPNYIGIELTESSLIDDMELTTNKLHQIHKLGIKIAIDDFGTGYSSLGYLIDFPISRIKIDRSFTKVIENNHKIEAIVLAINMMAKSLNIEVVAEGIETEAQLSIVAKLKCHIAQGYLFDRPLPKEEIEKKWLTAVSL